MLMINTKEASTTGPLAPSWWFMLRVPNQVTTCQLGAPWPVMLQIILVMKCVTLASHVNHGVTEARPSKEKVCLVSSCTVTKFLLAGMISDL